MRIPFPFFTVSSYGNQTRLTTVLRYHRNWHIRQAFKFNPFMGLYSAYFKCFPFAAAKDVSESSPPSAINCHWSRAAR